MPKNKDFFSIKEVADMLQISRVSVFKKVQKGQMKAKRVGKSYIIPREQVQDLTFEKLPEHVKKEIEKGVAKVVREYGETLRRLAKD